MPLYKVIGSVCGSTDSLYAPMSNPISTAACPNCGCKAKRVFTPLGVQIPWKEHFNHSVGKYVRNKQEFDSALSKGADEASERTGVEHKYVPVQAGDIKPES